ncbi:MAG: hypothetical protein ACYTEW_18845, partial [Planctomycetota bacterium]
VGAAIALAMPLAINDQARRIEKCRMSRMVRFIMFSWKKSTTAATMGKTKGAGPCAGSGTPWIPVGGGSTIRWLPIISSQARLASPTGTPTGANGWTSGPDGHADRRKWMDKRTLEFIEMNKQNPASHSGMETPSPDNEDLRWLVEHYWSKERGLR